VADLKELTEHLEEILTTAGYEHTRLPQETGGGLAIWRPYETRGRFGLAPLEIRVQCEYRRGFTFDEADSVLIRHWEHDAFTGHCDHVYPVEGAGPWNFAHQIAGRVGVLESLWGQQGANRDAS